MELPLAPPPLSCASSSAFRLHLSPVAPNTPARAPLLARARRNKGSPSDDAEPKVITIGRPGRKSRRRRGGGGKRQTPRAPEQQDEEEDENDDDEEDERDAAIPEVVTNRMMRRVGVSVGAPLAVGVGFFPAFYYLKTVAKVDVPTWIPFGVSFVFFGAALLGVSYGIVSASWDPSREGSLLGWSEARRNWPVFWDSLRGGGPAPPRRR
ncbi:protein PAM68, chloroplastic-like [Oryza brachyantha]|uniref:Protein PAM68, chloroplastic n=1 Tax=Oryza brachyantha TaxID=4533 RepID=J3MDM7_ORYBR|nr:protein PAM68, chloroplastic-like [Oryza brachyantha]